MNHQQPRRNTKQRELILRVVAQLGSHPTAEMIFDEVRKELPVTSLSTVYRNLGILVDQGDILAVRSPGRKIHYDHNTKEHNHIKCSVCGRVSDVDFNTSEINVLKPEDVSGFEVEEVYLNIVGICPQCLKTMKKEEAE